MSLFLKNGSRFKVTSKRALDLHDELPVATYIVDFDNCSKELFLEEIEDFKIEHKLYGKVNRRADRILNTFQQRKKQTGVLLSGEKGSGKSLLAKKLSIEAAKKGIPTIVINSCWHGEKFNNFIQSITQPKVVIFDEFEKIYQDSFEKQDQDKLLTLLDGVYGSKTLFVLTCNDPQKINSAIKNRPGRIYYFIEFDGLDESFIKDYCSDVLENKSHLEPICALSRIFMGKFNFDMLKAMVEELNRYPEDSPNDVLELLNVKPQHANECEHKIKLYVDGKPLNEIQLNIDSVWHGNPMLNGVEICGYDYENGGQKFFRFAISDLQSLDVEKGVFVFANDQRERLVLRREIPDVRGWKPHIPIPTCVETEDNYEVEEKRDTKEETKNEKVQSQDEGSDFSAVEAPSGDEQTVAHE